MAKRQKLLPEMEDELVEEIHNLAMNLHETTLRRKNLKQIEDDLTEQLLSTMRLAERKTYRHGGIFVSIEHKEKPKVEISNDGDAE